MTTWKIKQIGKLPKLKDAILIEGLPGIGNVGKLVVDFMIEEMKAVKLYEILSYSFPHSVFVNEDNLVELPYIELYYKQGKGKTPGLVFLAGDIQPMDEQSSYEFCDKIIELFKKLGGKEIITLGGIGLADAPKSPKLYCTANDKKIIKKYKDKSLNENIYGVVGPIIGVSGLLVGLSAEAKIHAISILAETLGHPAYLGVKGARKILNILSSKLGLKIDVKKFDKEIKDLEDELLKKAEEFSSVAQQTAVKKLQSKIKGDMNYIG